MYISVAGFSFNMETRQEHTEKMTIISLIREESQFLAQINTVEL